MVSFEEKTKELKSLIRRGRKSAEEAWKAGEILYSIKTNNEYIKNGYINFNAYTEAEFFIKEVTANKYITVFEKIPFEITKTILVTPLYILAEMDDHLRHDLIDAIRIIDSGSSNEKYTEYVIGTVKRLLESAKRTLSAQEIKQLIRDVQHWEKEERREKRAQKRKTKKTFPFEVGLPVKARFFQELQKLYSNQPIDEQGLVGLFSVMFFLLKNKVFRYNDTIVSFSRIIYIRTRFPDAQFKINIHDAKLKPIKETDLFVEFEYRSRNYFTHEHDKADESCGMIICREDNLKDNRFESPPVLSIKHLLSVCVEELPK